jgi:hypothetical protein
MDIPLYPSFRINMDKQTKLTDTFGGKSIPDQVILEAIVLIAQKYNSVPKDA